VLTPTAGALERNRTVSRVGERALAVVRSDHRVDVYHSQWAGSVNRLTRVLETPVDPVAALAGADWQYRGRWPPGTLSRRVDALDIAVVYHVSASGVTVYLPVWLGFTWPGERVTRGVLVRVDTYEQCRCLRATLRFLKSVFHEAIGLDLLDSDTARDLLALALRTRCSPDRIHTPGTRL
jgi:hypothetical protein